MGHANFGVYRSYIPGSSTGLEIEVDSNNDIILLAGIHAKVEMDAIIFDDYYSSYFISFWNSVFGLASSQFFSFATFDHDFNFQFTVGYFWFSLFLYGLGFS